MNLLMKVILSILSLFLFLNCDSTAQADLTEQMPTSEEIDEFTFEHFLSYIEKEGPYQPLILKELTHKLNETITGVEILPKGNDIDPKCIFFKPIETAALATIVEQLTKELGHPTKYDTYQTWRASFRGKKVIEFNMYYHPTLSQIIELRFRTQE